MIGPYDHFGGQINAVPDLRGYAIDPVANRSMGDLAFEWFDHVLKGMPIPAPIADAVNYQVMGTNEWKHAPSIDAMSNDALRLYLGTDEQTGLGRLEDTAPDDGQFRLQIVDFADRQTQNNDFTPLIVRDELPASHGVGFASEILEEGVELSGSLSGRLNVTTNKRDFDFSVALYEQMADGRFFFLNRHLGRASLARNRSRRVLLSPGETYTIPLRDTKVSSRKLSAGSRIVLVVNVNKNAFEEINYGSGGAVSEESVSDADVPLEVRWHADSYIELPIWR
ncbi:MAG: CocE/NonD family hydrolase C-terminal non-catalytic domain-containing protein [Gammaproteobacteria bacterium]